MVSGKKSLVLIVYRFPPMGGIGSRRWAKFCKYLCRDGWDIHVITSEYPWVDSVNWERDVEGLTNLKVIRLPSNYPPIFLRPLTTNKLHNVLVKIWRFVFHRLYRQAMYLDYAGLWAESLVSFASDYIRKESICNLVVSGPPSSLHLAGALIKSEVPWVNLIQDYRDPWSNTHDVSMKTLRNAKVKSDILSKESLALQVADQVVVVTKQMADEIHKIFAVSQKKISLICNGYDREDYVTDQRISHHVETNKIKLVYLGLIGSNSKGRLAAFNLIAEVMDSLPLEFVQRFEIHIYSNLPIKYFAESESLFLRSSLKCHAMVPTQDVAAVLASADICLSINGQEDASAYGTKLFEYMGAGKPILQITPSGEVVDLLMQAGQYVVTYDFKQISDVFKKICSDYDSSLGLASVKNEIYSQFDLLKLAKKYAELLITHE